MSIVRWICEKTVCRKDLQRLRDMEAEQAERVKRIEQARQELTETLPRRGAMGHAESW